MALQNLQQICSIPFRSKLYPSYYHSFGMTENYIIFVEQAFKLDIMGLAMAYFRGHTWGKCLNYDQDDNVSKAFRSRKIITHIYIYIYILDLLSVVVIIL